MSQEAKKSRRKDAKKEKECQEQEKSEEPKDTDDTNLIEDAKPKYGPNITIPYQRLWSRCVLILGVLLIVWYNSRQGKEVFLAKQKDILLSRTQNVECSEQYRTEVSKNPGCMPEKCGRVVTDKLVSSTETDVLLGLARRGLNLGGPDVGVNIFNLDAGILNKGEESINIYSLPGTENIFTKAELSIYKVVRQKMHHAVAQQFRLNVDMVHVTQPTFFSRITTAPANTVREEYWHSRSDKDTHKSVYYTSILYLTDYGRDFEGGRFVFIDKNNVNSTVEPRKGRVVTFTSGSENTHAVEKVTSGIRYALRVSFACGMNEAGADSSTITLSAGAKEKTRPPNVDPVHKVTTVS